MSVNPAAKNTGQAQKVQPQLLKGFRDYLPEDAAPLRELIRRVEEVFTRFGFSPLMTPALEYADLLTGKYGPEADKLMYRFVDHGGRHVAMRYDHTVPLARVIATNQDLPLPFKRFTIAPVWRADKPQRGRLREFYQCDVDIVGSDQARADAEVLAVAHQLFVALGIKKFGIQVSHRGVLDALVRATGVSETQVPGVFHAIDKLPKYGEAIFVKDTAALGLTSKQTQALLELIGSTTRGSAVLKKLDKTLLDETGRSALSELTAIIEHAHALGVPPEQLHVDLRIVRGLDYYTGMVVESVIEDLPLYGSVFGGGRYDGLIGSIAGRAVPAVGISLGLGRLFDALRELKLLPQAEPAARVMIALFADAEAGISTDAIEGVAHVLRAAGISTEVYLGHPTKLDKQLKYADKRGIVLVVWQGPEEHKHGVFALKDLRTGKQQDVSIDDLVATIKKLA